MKTYNTTGIVLRRGDYRENDRLFVLYTKDFGKLEVVARGTKKILSKLNPHLEPFNEVKVMIAKGRGYDKLGNAISINNFSKLKESTDIGVTASVQYVLEVTEKMVQHKFPEDDVYNNLYEGLHFMQGQVCDGAPIGQHYFFANVYVLKLLDLLGYRPELTRCTECSKGILFPKITYDFLRGGLVCENCKPITIIHDHYDISDSVIKIMSTVMGENYLTLLNYQFQPEDQKEFNSIVAKLLEYQLDRKVHSLDFLHSIK